MTGLPLAVGEVAPHVGNADEGKLSLDDQEVEKRRHSCYLLEGLASQRSSNRPWLSKFLLPPKSNTTLETKLLIHDPQGPFLM